MLVASSSAIKTPDGSPVYPLEFHFNEDPHSVPDPIAGKKYMTTTQAKYLSKDTWDTDTEDKSINPMFAGQFNHHAWEPKQQWMTKYWGHETLDVQLKDKEESDSDSDSSDSDSDSDEEHHDQANVQWQVTPDLGELDDHSTLYREFDKDYEIGKAKFSGWTNPLGWRDNGNDDDLVLMQMTANGLVERRIPDSALLQYEESEGPTKVDLSDADMHVVGREADHDYQDDAPLGYKKKFHGWTNPLSWTDDGSDDGTVL